MSYSSANRAGSLCAASISSRSSGSRSRAFTAFSAVRLSVWLMGREAQKVTRPCAFLWDAKPSEESSTLEGKWEGVSADHGTRRQSKALKHDLSRRIRGGKIWRSDSRFPLLGCAKLLANIKSL